MPKGVETPADVKAEALALVAGGMSAPAAARRLGIPRSTVYGWVEDPDGAKKAARIDSYRGTCSQCGGATDGSKGRANAPTLCLSCIEWTDEATIAAMQDWAERHGGVPPTCTQWRTAAVDHPAATVITKRSREGGRPGWNDLLLLAGFELACDRRPGTQARMEQMLREGRSTAEVAEHFGCTTQNVYIRLRTRGLRVSDLREAA